MQALRRQSGPGSRSGIVITSVLIGNCQLSAQLPRILRQLQMLPTVDVTTAADAIAADARLGGARCEQSAPRIARGQQGVM